MGGILGCVFYELEVVNDTLHLFEVEKCWCNELTCGKQRDIGWEPVLSALESMDIRGNLLYRLKSLQEPGKTQFTSPNEVSLNQPCIAWTITASHHRPHGPYGIAASVRS